MNNGLWYDITTAITSLADENFPASLEPFEYTIMYAIFHWPKHCTSAHDTMHLQVI
jgi:hypothetical protein